MEVSVFALLFLFLISLSIHSNFFLCRSSLVSLTLVRYFYLMNRSSRPLFLLTIPRSKKSASKGPYAQKQLGGPPILGDSSLHQPIGLTLAATAASLMAGALGGAQTSSIQSGLQSQSGMGNDPLTHYLARMSRHRLNEIVSEIKALATQSKALAQQLLQGSPQLTKALFQAQIMLGMVTPQMMQMTNSQRSSTSAPQPSSHHGQTPSQKDALVGILSRPNVPQNPTILHQSALPMPNVPVQPPYQHPLPPEAQVLHQGTIPGKSGASITSSTRPQPLGGPSIQPNPPLPASKGLIPQIQPLLPQQHPRSTEAAPSVQHPQLALPNTSLQQSLLSLPPMSQASLVTVKCIVDYICHMEN